MVYQYPDVPIAQYHAEIVEVCLSQRPIFALAYWKLIAMQIIAKNGIWIVYNFWEVESWKEKAWMGSVCLCGPACVFVATSKIVQRTDAPPKL